jgi:predicted esterase
MLHGRGASAEDILSLAPLIDPGEISYLAPEAADGSWYPDSFLAPIESNEPWLTSAFRRIESVFERVEQAGGSPARTVLLGFSQGACLALEFAVRFEKQYGGLVAFSGGLMGPPGTTWPRTGSLAGTSIYLGCGDLDSYIPLERVTKTAEVLQELGGEVQTRIFSGMGHMVNSQELQAAAKILQQLVHS